MSAHRYLFIPGISRSGTSWIAKWLGSHPDVAVFHEAYLIRYAHEMLHHEPVGGRIVRRTELRAFLDSVYDRAAGERRFIVDKSPVKLLHCGQVVIDTIFRLYPEARVLCLYRDGKNFVHGLLNLPWKASTVWTVESAAAYWNAEIEILMRVFSDYSGDERLRIMRYEDLVSDPSSSRSITGFMGLDHHDDIEVWRRPVNTVHARNDPDRWKALDRKSRDIMRMMNPKLERLGFEPVT